MSYIIEEGPKFDFKEYSRGIMNCYFKRRFKKEMEQVDDTASTKELQPILTFPNVGNNDRERPDIQEDELEYLERIVAQLRQGHKTGRRVTACEHRDRKHYARGMCKNCYNTKGRPQRATLCPHTDRLNYAKNRC